ncbi:MAG: isoprenylcysteine carboxylmethyltransferase family protein [archaeon]|nr:isoprenylcysteine carboxylmethyltransferase family protein [archaeon]
MALIPAFELGLWNAWIFMLYHFSPTPLLMLFHKGPTATKHPERQNKPDRKRNTVMWIIWLLGFGYSFFLPLKMGTIWFYMGLPLALVGVLTYTLVIVTFATTPLDKEPMTTGLYRYSRHPMYVTTFVLFSGVSITSASWLFLLFSVVYTVLSVVHAITEERSCLEKYGDAYREYISRTPRWIGLPKSGKSDKSCHYYPSFEKL